MSCRWDRAKENYAELRSDYIAKKTRSEKDLFRAKWAKKAFSEVALAEFISSASRTN